MSRDIENGSEQAHFRFSRACLPEPGLVFTVLALFTAWYLFGYLQSLEETIVGGLAVVFVAWLTKLAGGIAWGRWKKWRQRRSASTERVRLPSPNAFQLRPTPPTPRGSPKHRVLIRWVRPDQKRLAHSLVSHLEGHGWQAAVLTAPLRKPPQEMPVGFEVRGPDPDLILGLVARLAMKGVTANPILGELPKEPGHERDAEIWLGEA